MKAPLDNSYARCVSDKCNLKNVCQRRLTIELDKDPLFWFADFRKEFPSLEVAHSKSGTDEKCYFFMEGRFT
jgi:hypothetical protein